MKSKIGGYNTNRLLKKNYVEIKFHIELPFDYKVKPLAIKDQVIAD